MVRLGCSKMHFHPLIKAIVFSSVPLDELMNMCDVWGLKILIGSPKGTDEKTMALIKGWKCILKHPRVGKFEIPAYTAVSWVFIDLNTSSS